MPVIGWIILLASLALILGSLFMLRDTSSTMTLSGDKLEKVRKRKAEQEEKDDKNNYVRCERSFGSYSRQFDLSSVDADHMKAMAYNVARVHAGQLIGESVQETNEGVPA